MPIVIPSRQEIVDWTDLQDEVSCSINTAAQEILSITTKNNYRAFLAFVGIAWDPGLDTFLTWRVKKDGATIYQLQDSQVQIAPPEQPSQELTPWLELPQGCTVRLEVDIAGAAGSGNVAGRMKIYYAPLNS